MRQAQVLEDLQADAVVAQVGAVAEGEVGLDGVEPLVLEGVGPELLDQADPPPLLRQVDQGARRPRAPIISRAMWSWSPQSQRSESSRSPVKQDEWMPDQRGLDRARGRPSTKATGSLPGSCSTP